MTEIPIKNPKDKKHLGRSAKRIYHLKLFWFLVIIVLISSIVSGVNWALNNSNYQEKAATWIYQLTQTKLDYKDISFNLFFGEVKGTDLSVKVEKINLNLSLKEFKLNYNPLYLLIARFKVTKIHAKEFWLDTSELIKPEKTAKKVKFPEFLKRVKLKEAKIDKFFWNQPKGAQLSIDTITLNSKFGSLFYKTPLNMVIEDIEYRADKLHTFIEKLELDGFFLFDFSQPRIIDESKLSAKAKIDKVLLAFYRSPKPWLTDRGWDKDLEPLLNKYYPNEIPKDRSYLFIQQIAVDVQKTKYSFILNSFKINYYQNYLTGKGLLQSQWNNLNFQLKTLSPMDLSKLPLGQSKFRQSFDNFSLNLKLDGKFYSLTKNNINTTIQAKLHGNVINPQAGDISANLKGKIVNGELISDNFNIKLSDGNINASTKLKIKELTTQTNFTANNIDAQTVVRLFSSVNIPSRVNAKGSVTGKLNNPKISIDLNTENATYEFLNFGKASGNLLIDNKNLKLNVQTTGSAIGQSQLTMDIQKVFSSYDQVMKLKSTHSNINISNLLNARTIEGKISGTFDLQRVKARVSATGDFNTQNFEFFDHPIGSLNFKINLKLKHLEIRPITIELLKPKKTITSTRGLVFDFNELGYKFTGDLIDNLKISGSFSNLNKNYLQLMITPQKLSLDLFTSLLPITPESSLISGKIDLKYNIYNPYLSSMRGVFSEIDIQTTDAKFHLNKTGSLDYNNKAFVFRNFDITEGEGRVLLNGPIGLDRNSALHVKGLVDFTPLVDFNPYISESVTPINVDVTLRDYIFKPKVYGKVEFDKNSLQFRNMGTELESIIGTLRFEGNRISTQKLTLEYDDAPVELTGHITTDFEKITGANLNITGKEVPLHPFDGLSIVSDVDITLKGQHTLTLQGDLNIVEGQYNRNFSITNFIIKPADEALEFDTDTLAGLPLNTVYKLHIKNTGDLLIKNNLAELEMSADLDLLGTIDKPGLIGQIDFLSGKIHAFGIDFDDATGFAQFKKGKGFNPEISLTAKKEIQEFNITARIEGLADNLRLRLDSSPALDRREILSVIFYGQTPDQLTGENRRNFTQTAAISQLASILSQPLYKISGLDVLQVSSRRERSTESIQRLTVGKTLTNRFSLTFTSDLGINDPERAFELRYQIFDNFYLIAAKDVIEENRYRFDISFRFQFF